MNYPENSTFGGDASHIRSLAVEELCSMYVEKCNYDPSRHFDGLREIDLYECEKTGMRFWRPSRVAGDEAFYASLSQLWHNYYKTERWEYEGARQVIGSQGSRVLEVGCGRGYFLKSIETTAQNAAGLELNGKAIREKVTAFPVYPTTLQDHGRTMAREYDCVCSFQVLEHVADPMAFLTESALLVRRGGKLIISTPNYEFPLHASASDAFDLPPHHLNHFTPHVFERIANTLGFKLISTSVQESVSPKYKVWVSKDHSKLQRIIRSSVNRLINPLASKIDPGHTILAVFEVP